jgi:glycosyltransferase involved in cell wall biosynthesis
MVIEPTVTKKVKEQGGLRANENSTNSNYHTIKKVNLTIITVVFNDEKCLENTMLSVLEQCYKDIEYIIIDGGSTDGTVDIIKKYQHRINYWVSEKDNGIYDAMNKGVSLASGEWINFMNSGDFFYDNNTLKLVFESNDLKYTDVIFGHHQVVYPHKKKIAKAGFVKDIWKGSQFSHQSSFVRSSLLRKNVFNISNRISADFEFFYNQIKSKRVFKRKDIIISSISSGGVSDINRIDGIVGWWNVIDKSYMKNLYYIYLITKEMLKIWIKRVVF